VAATIRKPIFPRAVLRSSISFFSVAARAGGKLAADTASMGHKSVVIADGSILVPFQRVP
jgi:hypothetical protein